MKSIRLMAATLLAVGAVALSACGSDTASRQSADPSKYTGLLKKVAENGEITVVTTNTPPFSYVTASDKSVQGVVRDIFEGFLESEGLTGIEFKTRVLPFEDSLPAIQSGKADMILDLFYARPERKGLVDFSAPVAAIPEGLVVKKGNPNDIHAITDFCGRRVGVLTGSSPAEVVAAENAKCPANDKADVTQYKTYQAAVSDVSLGRVDAALYDAGTVAYAISQNPDVKYELVADYKPAVSGISVFMFPKGVKGILPQLDEYLAKIQSDGTEAKILEKYEMVPTASFLPPAQ